MSKRMRGRVQAIDDGYIGLYSDDAYEFYVGDEVVIEGVSESSDIEKLKISLKRQIDITTTLSGKLSKALARLDEMENRLDESPVQTQVGSLTRRVASLEQTTPSYQPLWNERIETLDAKLSKIESTTADVLDKAYSIRPRLIEPLKRRVSKIEERLREPNTAEIDTLYSQIKSLRMEMEKLKENISWDEVRKMVARVLDGDPY